MSWLKTYRFTVFIIATATSLFVICDSYGQAVSFDLEYAFNAKKKAIQKKIIKKGVTSQLISLPEYQNIRKKSLDLITKLKNRKMNSRNYSIGEEKEFYVRNVISGNTWYTEPAILSFKNSQVRIWVQKSAFDTLNNTQHFEKILNGFQNLLFNFTPSNSINSELGVLDILNEYVGEFPNVDGDGTLDVFLLNIIDDFEETGSFVAGFFDPVNLYEFEFSNEMDLVYLDLYPTVLSNEQVNVERVISTFAHEAQHLIHAGYEGDETELVFVNEGFSEVVEIICGFEPRSGEGYQEFSYRGLLSWNHKNPIPDYSRASLWTHYLVEQLGIHSLKELIQNSETGYKTYKRTIELYSPYNFEEFFHNWGIALIVNSNTIRSEFGYAHPQRQTQILSSVIESKQFPNAFKGQFEKLVHIPVSFPLTKKLTIQVEENSINNWITTFEQYPNSSEVNIESYNMPYITSYADRFKYGNIQSLITFVGMSEQTGKDGFSFLTDGEYSGRILNKGYGDGNPDQFYFNASYLTLNSHSQKVGVVFPPSKTSYWLKEFSIRTVFQSELVGSSFDGTEVRDFDIDIFTFKNGRPYTKLIPTVKFKSEREVGKLIEENFSLESFFDDLSALTDSLIIIVSNDADDNNFIAIGMDESEQNASFFSDAEISNDWVTFAKKSIGGNSLANWNPIVRISSVLPEVRQERDISIGTIEYDFNSVKVEVTPANEFDSSSVKVTAKLPDGSFQNGKLISKNENSFFFSFPVLVDDYYTLISSYQSPDGEVTYTDEKTWKIEIPDGFKLSDNYPNPFNPSTIIPFTLIENATITWQVYDVLGRVVMEIQELEFSSGEHIQEFNMKGLASGMYIVRAKLSRERNRTTIFRTQKIMLIK